MINSLYTKSKLLITITGHNHGEKIVKITKQAGAHGGTIIIGRGTAENQILQLLGIGDTDKDIVFTLSSEEELPVLIEALVSGSITDGKIRGITFSIDVSLFFKRNFSREPSIPWQKNYTGSDIMSIQANYQLIFVIINSGYADDTMAAARKAGAGGGTIINARGTVREEDIKFFGIPIVPEKELLLILVEKDKVSAILQAINELACLSEPGSGIAFCVDVEHYNNLGKNKFYHGDKRDE